MSSHEIDHEHGNVIGFEYAVGVFLTLEVKENESVTT